MAKILVTGGTGFVGSALVRRLAQSGHEVSVLVRPRSEMDELQGISFHTRTGDVTDAESVRAACVGMDYVFHLAGLIAYRRADRVAMDRVNVTGTRHVLSACMSEKVKRLIHLSSVVAVGASRKSTEILNEESPYRVGHLNLGYFESKRAAEKLVVTAARNQKIDAVILNPSTIYGPGDARKGSRKTQVKVAQGRFPFYTGGGVSVVPLENAIEGIMSGWQKGRSGERYILSGENLTIRELFALIAKAGGVPAPRWKLPSPLLHSLGVLGDFMASRSNRTGGPESSGAKSPLGSLSRENAWTATLFHWFDSTKAQQELGFKPGSAAVAIGNSVQWMREHGYLERER